MALPIIVAVGAALLQGQIELASVMPTIEQVAVEDSMTLDLVSADTSNTATSSNDPVVTTQTLARIIVSSKGAIPHAIPVTTVLDPVIPGTTVPLYEIAALLEGGATADEIKADYPPLTLKQIEESGVFAKENPYKGPRPYPKVSFKRALMKMDFYKYLPD